MKPYISHPYASILWPQTHVLTKHIALIILGVLVLAYSAQLSIPWQPVPLTFQSATVVLLGLIFGARLSSTIILSYLVSGACGLPVFAEQLSGLGVFFGPTGGYLFGFLPAAIVTGWLAQRGTVKNMLSAFITACIGASIIFICGVAWLAKMIGWHHAYQLGVYPFIMTESIKLIAVSMIAPRFWKVNPNANQL